jgi:hypothetical protein
LAPLPPRRLRMPASPSALPSPKVYTHFVIGLRSPCQELRPPAGIGAGLDHRPPKRNSNGQGSLTGPPVRERALMGPLPERCALAGDDSTCRSFSRPCGPRRAGRRSPRGARGAGRFPARGGSREVVLGREGRPPNGGIDAPRARRLWLLASRFGARGPSGVRPPGPFRLKRSRAAPVLVARSLPEAAAPQDPGRARPPPGRTARPDAP